MTETDRVSAITARKAEHLELALRRDAQFPLAAGWFEIELVHTSLPEIDLQEVELATDFFGHRLEAPLVIAGMTGGHPDAEGLNEAFGAAAQRHGLAVGVGSQRAALVEPGLESTYSAIRRSAPDAFVIANIGAAQLIGQEGSDAISAADVQRLVDMVGANALAVHLNFLEEAVQPEGDRRARGCATAIGRLCEQLPIPVVAKETGGGMSAETAEQLAALGVAGLDVGGAGGTSFTAIEQLRADRQGDVTGISLGKTFAGWGIPTPAAVAAASEAGLPVLATGGVRSGLDAAKALALGATAVGVARPVLAAALEGDDAIDAWINQFRAELRTALFLTGSSSPRELRHRRLLVTGRTRDWMTALGTRAAHPGPGQ